MFCILLRKISVFRRNAPINAKRFIQERDAIINLRDEEGFINIKKWATTLKNLQQTHYRAEEHFPKFIILSVPLDISRRVSRHCSIPSNHPITYQRYEKGNRHTPRSIRNISHDYRSNRTTHYRHDE